MNKISLFIFLAIATLGFNGCSNNPQTGANDTEDNGDYYFGRSRQNDNNDPF